MSEAEISMLEHCTGEQIKELLGLATATPPVDSEWFLEIGDADQLNRLIAELCGDVESADELVQTVCSADAALGSLVAAKNAAKRLAASAETPTFKAAAGLLYHLAIASALARHGRNISSKDIAARLPLYRRLADDLSDGDLAAIFDGAVEASRFSASDQHTALPPGDTEGVI